jgi:hypothetical protein
MLLFQKHVQKHKLQEHNGAEHLHAYTTEYPSQKIM